MTESSPVPAASNSTARRFRILIINPNSTSSMTESLRSAYGDGSRDVDYHYFTAPSGPLSINNEEDAAKSVRHCVEVLETGNYLTEYDAFLVACYSQHPLVTWLIQESTTRGKRRAGKETPVTGIFEASVKRSLKAIQPDEAFGIVSTGKVWENLLSKAVHDYSAHTGEQAETRFAGVETTGLNATELHDAPADEVRTKMKEATKRLVAGKAVGAICLGCAGMVGMDQIVKEALLEQLGEQKGSQVEIVDGVKEGIVLLEQILKMEM